MSKMQQQEEVIVDIGPAGETTVSVGCGVQGIACKDLTRDIERALGKTKADTPTNQMFAQPGVPVARGR